MRRTATMVTLATLLPLAAAVQAAAGTDPGHIDDVAADANGTDPRFAGGPMPADQETGPASIAALDITGADLSASRVVVHLLKADPTLVTRFVATIKSSDCATVTLEWHNDWTQSLLSGCRQRQHVLLPAGRYDGNDVVLPMPTQWPSWLPAGTHVSRLSVQTTAVVGLEVGEIWPSGDYAVGNVDVTLG